MNIFEEIYEKVNQQAKAVCAAKSDKEREEARQLLNETISEIESLDFYTIHIWCEYKNARDCGNSRLNLSEIIWDHQVSEMVACMKANGIEKFTFSATYTEAIKTAWLFQQEGCVLEGFVEINSTYTDAYGEHTKVPALLFRIK